MAKKPIIAIMYDFDKTLCTTDMQNYKFIPDVGMTPEEFWGATGEFGNKYQIEKILAYMYMMIKKAKEKNIKLTKEYLNSLGASIQYYKGVEEWFDRINNYGSALGLKVEHYIISSGTKEIIEGSKIAKKFRKIYACEFLYNEDGEAIWPRLTINYTQKTQFVFRIGKGVENINDDDKVNMRVESDKKRVLYRDMIYLGDGITDVPCMRLIKDKGGLSIALYKNKAENAKILFKDERVNFMCKADYSENSQLDNIIKLQLQNIALYHKMDDKLQKQKREVIKAEEKK